MGTLLISKIREEYPGNGLDDLLYSTLFELALPVLVSVLQSCAGTTLV